MATYEYTARDESGNEFSGTYNNIDSVRTLQDDLAKMGYTLTGGRWKSSIELPKRIKQSEVITFAYKFAGMYAAGLSIVESLEMLKDQADSRAFKNIIEDIKASIEAGASLKKAFAKHGRIFSEFYLGMLEVGESGGKLGTTLEMGASYLENREDIKRKIKAAFTYPAIVSIMCIIIVTSLVIFVIPVFAKVYKQLHATLPAPTQALIDISMLTRQWWWAILIVVAGAAFFLRKLFKHPDFRIKWDIYKLNMPVFGKLNRMLVVSRFTRAFAMLTSAGVSFIQALDIANLVADNYKISKITAELQKSIESGNAVAKSMQNYDLFPSMLVHLAASGEQAGKLPEMLNKGVDFLDKDINRTINSLLVKLEPVMTVIMGTIVGLILLGVYLPMFDYMTHIK